MVASPGKPVVGCFCSTFLAAEMQHVYRQITGLKRFDPLVLTQKRANPDQFPFPSDRIVELNRPPGILREWRRFSSRRITKRPPKMFDSERRELESQLAKNGARLLHAYFGNSGFYLLPLLKSASKPCPIVVSFHGADAGVEMDKPGYREAMREVFECADAILGRSESLLSELGQLGCPQEKLRLSRTGIPLEEWPRAEGRITPGDGRWRIIQAGRLIEKKGYDISLRAFAAFRGEHPRARFQIVGKGPLKSELESLAGELGIADSVEFSGFLGQEALRAAYGKSHLFFHPSRTGADGNREGIPNSMLEAMATGLPVIATNHGGIPEAVEDGASGFLVPENDPDALAEKALIVAGDSQLWMRLGDTAVRHVGSRFRRKQQIEHLESIYDSL